MSYMLYMEVISYVTCAAAAVFSTCSQQHVCGFTDLLAVANLSTQQKSHHLDLTKQLGKNLPLDNYCMYNYVSAGNKLFNPNWCSE